MDGREGHKPQLQGQELGQSGLGKETAELWTAGGKGGVFVNHLGFSPSPQNLG